MGECGVRIELRTLILEPRKVSQPPVVLYGCAELQMQYSTMPPHLSICVGGCKIRLCNDVDR